MLKEEDLKITLGILAIFLSPIISGYYKVKNILFKDDT